MRDTLLHFVTLSAVDHDAFNYTNTPAQQTPYTGDRARCAASTAPNTRGWNAWEQGSLRAPAGSTEVMQMQQVG